MIGFDSSLNLFGIEEYGARSGNERKVEINGSWYMPLQNVRKYWIYNIHRNIYFTFRLYSSIGIITRSLNKEGEMWDIYMHI